MARKQETKTTTKKKTPAKRTTKKAVAEVKAPEVTVEEPKAEAVEEVKEEPKAEAAEEVKEEKTVEITYMPAEYEALASATAVVTISDKATISPDPAQPTDYTAGPVQFTVTAEDPEYKAVYTVNLAEAEFTEKAEFKWYKTYGELGLNGPNTGQCAIAFCDVDKFAYNSLDVFDLEGNKLGVLNTDGIPGLDTYNGQLGSMSNDENGVLVACCCNCVHT